MSAWQLVVLSLALLSASRPVGGDVPFTSAGIASLRGRDVCDLQGDFPKRFGLYLDRRKQHVVQYLERDGVSALFLLGQPLSSDCGVVEAVLDLTSMRKTGETPEFKCYTDSEGGTAFGKWGRIVALADNEAGTKRYVKARLAWKVNVQKRRFEPINREAVHCDTSGYTD